MKVLALNKNGDITFCTVPPEKRGIGRCNHIEHQNQGEPVDKFLARIEKIKNSIDKTFEDNKIGNGGKESYKLIDQKEINELAEKLDSIVGQKLTLDNYKEILNSLTPKQLDDISKISFNASPNFSLPITTEEYFDEELKTQLYFANLPEYGIAGNLDSIAQMFKKIGKVPVLNEDPVEINKSFKEGLTPGEYFNKQFIARDATICKNVGTAKPGYSARKLFYALSDIMVIKDCGGPHIDVLNCKAPEGHVCQICARLTKGGERIKEGDLIGGLISTNMSEALTQLSMKQMHPIWEDQELTVLRKEEVEV